MARGGLALSSSNRHRACLRTLFPFLLSEANRGSRLQVVEVSVEHAIGMKVNFAAVGRLEEPITVLGEDAGHSRDCGQFVSLYALAQFTQMILEAPARRVEGFADRDCQILGVLPGDREFGLRPAHVDANLEWTSLAMVVNGGLDYDVASGEPFEVETQRFGATANVPPWTRSGESHAK